MKKYLVRRIVHRLDGISLATCVDPGRGRTASLRFRTDAFDIPLIPGRMYMLRITARNRGVNVVAAVECGIDVSAWEELVDNHFFVSDLQLKVRAKRNLLSLTYSQIEELLDSLIQNDMRPWRNVLHEAQSTQLGYAFQEAGTRYQSVKRLMSWGLSQAQAETAYDTHGAATYKAPLGRMKALLSSGSSHQIKSALSTDSSLPSDHRTVIKLMSWLKDQGRRGRTVFHMRDLPKDSTKALQLCAEWGWMVVDGELCQLPSHTMLQVGIRRQLERVSSQFFPTYTPQEIQFGYSRYSQVIASHDYTHLQDEITAVVNSRISVLTARDIPSICEFTNQLSGTLQILYAPAPVVSVYSEAMLAAYRACTDSRTVPLFQLPSDLPDYSTIVMTDCHFLSLSDFLVALKSIPATARLVLVDQRPMLSEQPPHFLDELKTYYPIIPLHREETLKPQTWLMPQQLADEHPVFDVHQAKRWQQVFIEEIFVSDCSSVIAAVNQRLSRVRSPVILETAETSFRKHDKVNFHPAYGDKWDSFIGTIHSVSVKGLFVAIGDHYTTLTAEFVHKSDASLAFAMSLESAVKAGVRSTVLIVRGSEIESSVAYLKAYGINVTGVYVHNQTTASKTAKTTCQRLTPLVE